MSNTHTQLLDAQLSFLDECVEHRVDDLGQRRRNIEDLIALALLTLERIRKRCDTYNVVAGDTPGPEAAELLGYWRRWHDIAVRALRDIDRMQAQGCVPENGDAFRFAVNEAAIAAQWDKVLEARASVEAGKVRSLEEIEDELSHQSG